MGYLHLYEDARDWADKEMSYFERLFDLFIDRLILITDYFILSKRLSLTEMMIWWVALLRGVWSVFVEVDSPYNMVMSNMAWMWVYLAVSVIHTFTFFRTTRERAYAVCLQAVVWCTLGWLAAVSASPSFALPTAVVFAMGSAFVAVRLFREK